MENKINNELKVAFRKGFQKASEVYDDSLRIEHVIWGVLTTQNFLSEVITDQIGDISDLKVELNKLVNTISTRDNKKGDPMLKFEDGLMDLINGIDKSVNGEKVGVEDFFLKIYDSNLEVIRILESYGITKTFIETKIKNKNIVSKSDFQGHDEDEWPSKNKKVKDNGSKTPVLDNFCRDITELARQDALDPVIGRDVEIERVAQILARRKKNNPILVGEPGVGKCLGRGTKVLMYDGNFKNVEDIIVGDQLMGVDSTPRNVLSLGSGIDQMYKITQNKGIEYHVNSEHILSLKASGSKKHKTGDIVNITIQEYLNLNKTEQSKLKGWKTGIDFNEKYVPIDPYYIGLWLGDGSSSKNDITNIDEPIINYLNDLAKKYGLVLTKDDITYKLANKNQFKLRQINPNTGEIIGYWGSALEFANTLGVSGRSISDCINGKQKIAYGFKWELMSRTNPINDILKELGIWNNKHIPEIYLKNSRDVRLKVLAGLIDSDGYLTNNIYEISQKNEQLFNNIVYLVRSLGFIANINKPKVINGEIYHRMSISGNNFSELPILLDRKIIKNKSNRTNKLITAIEVTQDIVDEYFGFNIDGDHLFILEDFTVTHNTAIVEGLARLIVLNECPRPLKDKRIAALDLAAMVAGTKYRGQFEERIKALIDELKDATDVILFIDEIHTLIGAGNSSGSLDAANILKPALARGEVQCIGATTVDEYKKSIEKDGALDRRFQKVGVDEPTAAETLEIIKRLQGKYEYFHNVNYTPEAIEEIVRLSDRYITNRFFPDKAIDVMDEAGSRSQVSLKIPQHIKDLEAELQAVKDEKMLVVQNQKFELAAGLRDKETKLVRKLEDEKTKLKETANDERMVIDENIVSEVVAMMTGVPVNKVSQNEVKKLLNIDSEIKNSVIGQDTAINAVAGAIKRNRTGVRRKGKPIGSFLFVGPSGVGKTELAKVLAEKVFGSRDALIKVDMSEYAEKFNASKLIGSPPGYVGYEEGGQLTEKVRNKPYSVVLFDEIEKAHPDIFNVLLQLLDEGQLTDGLGRVTNFKNTIVIMTSNVGLKQLENFGTGIGFASSKNDNRKSILDKAIKDKFRPEFINRIDEIVFFNTLSEENLMGIIDLQLAELSARLKEDLDYDLKFDQALKEIILKEGYDESFGAREIQRTIQRYVEDPISEKLLEMGLPKSGTFNVTYNVENNETVVSPS